MNCVICRKAVAESMFGYRENSRTGEVAHTDCLGVVRSYGDSGGKAWANARSWSRIVINR